MVVVIRAYRAGSIMWVSCSFGKGSSFTSKFLESCILPRLQSWSISSIGVYSMTGKGYLVEIFILDSAWLDWAGD